MEVKRIRLKTLKNTRDLGGMVTADSRVIKPKRLIRSSCLSKAHKNDIEVLTGSYDLSCVIDLRTGAELEEAPESLPESVRYVHLPLLDDSFFGIARDKFSVKAWFNIFENTLDSPENVFGRMYEDIVFGERNGEYIRRFFELLLENASGSVLWHCSAGKDRVGLLTLLLLSALGVDRQTVMRDYLATAFFTAPDILKAHILAPFILRKRNQRKCFYVLMGVKKAYAERVFQRIDRDFGSIENYLFKHCGITPKEIENLKDKYLTRLSDRHGKQ